MQVNLHCEHQSIGFMTFDPLIFDCDTGDPWKTMLFCFFRVAARLNTNKTALAEKSIHWWGKDVITFASRWNLTCELTSLCLYANRNQVGRTFLVGKKWSHCIDWLLFLPVCQYFLISHVSTSGSRRSIMQLHHLRSFTVPFYLFFLMNLHFLKSWFWQNGQCLGIYK